MCNTHIYFFLSPEPHIKFPPNTSTLKHSGHCVQAYQLHNTKTKFCGLSKASFIFSLQQVAYFSLNSIYGSDFVKEKQFSYL